MAELIDSHQQAHALILQALRRPGLMLSLRSAASPYLPQGDR
ncbi:MULTISPECIES: hypothetical protein [unclassified Synechococcus]|nr:hypothetical protein [Synechococcus sp. WH 8020]